MGTKLRHHYVPRFYIKAFQSAPRRIHLLHLRRQRSIKNASLRDQCYRHRFYGADDDLENGLAQVEQRAALVLRDIRESGRPPAWNSKEHGVLLAFVALQMLRTPTARARIKEAAQNLDEVVFGDWQPPDDWPLQRVSPGLGEPEIVPLQLSPLQMGIQELADLRLQVGVCSRGEIITSDNPIFKYNTYCRGVKNRGVLGVQCRGLQLFVPLSPHVLLTMYDGAVYLPPCAEGSSSKLRRKDVAQLNTAHTVTADRCVYFANWDHAENLKNLALKHRWRHVSKPMQIVEGELLGSENSSIVHQWERQPDLGTSLPFSRIRASALKVPVHQRGYLYRREPLW